MLRGTFKGKRKGYRDVARVRKEVGESIRYKWGTNRHSQTANRRIFRDHCRVWRTGKYITKIDGEDAGKDISTLARKGWHEKDNKKCSPNTGSFFIRRRIWKIKIPCENSFSCRHAWEGTIIESIASSFSPNL